MSRFVLRHHIDDNSEPELELIAGSLVSPLNAVTLQQEFVDYQDRHGAIVRDYLARDVSAHDTARKLADFTLVSDRYEWTIGATTGRWYRRLADDTVWEPALPPAAPANYTHAVDDELDITDTVEVTTGDDTVVDTDVPATSTEHWPDSLSAFSDPIVDELADVAAPAVTADVAEPAGGHVVGSAPSDDLSAWLETLDG